LKDNQISFAERREINKLLRCEAHFGLLLDKLIINVPSGTPSCPSGNLLSVWGVGWLF